MYDVEKAAISVAGRLRDEGLGDWLCPYAQDWIAAALRDAYAAGLEAAAVACERLDSDRLSCEYAAAVRAQKGNHSATAAPPNP